ERTIKKPPRFGGMKTYNWEGVNPDGYFLDKLEPIPSALPSFQKLFQVSATALSIPCQTYKHSVPRFFVPEHGTMFTLALVRFPPTATKEIQYLNAKGALTYTDIAGDPVLYGNLPPR